MGTEGAWCESHTRSECRIKFNTPRKFTCVVEEKKWRRNENFSEFDSCHLNASKFAICTQFACMGTRRLMLHKDTSEMHCKDMNIYAVLLVSRDNAKTGQLALKTKSH